MVKIKKDVPILMCNRPTINGRIYPKQEVEIAITKINNPPLLGMFGPQEGLAINLGEVAFIAENLKFNDFNGLEADIRTLETPKGQILNPILDLCEFTTVGTGTIGMDGVISDFKISYISANAKPATSR